MSEAPLWLTETEVVRLMHLGEAMTALEAGLREQQAGRALNMSKTHAAWDGSTLHAIGAVFQDQGWFGTKTWGHTEGGATPLFILWRADGTLAAIIEAFALGQMRTGGISGVATRWLAAPDADELAVIGSGKQALAQVAAVALVRELKRVRVYSPTPANRAAFAAKLRTQGFGFEVVEADDVRAAVDGVPIVTTVTRARQPFLDAAMLAPGTHVNAVGAITPERVELAPDVIERCGIAAVDDPAAARKLATEFRDLFAVEGRVSALAKHVGLPRPPDVDISIFKAMGMGISDLSLAVELHARAQGQGVGRPFTHPTRAAPRLRP